jgi:hypothetical protein
MIAVRKLWRASLIPKHRSEIIIQILIALALLSASSLPAADRVRTGNWELKNTTFGRTRTLIHCMTKEEVGGANGDTKTARAFAEKGAVKSGCTIKGYNVTGNTVTYVIECKGDLFESSTTYQGDTFQGTLKSTHKGIQVTTTVAGRRLGPCPASAATATASPRSGP